MKKLFARFAGNKNAQPQSFDAVLAPAETLAVIGDIHGCDRLLVALMERVAKAEPDRLIFVGDFIDRGEESAAVLRRLFQLAQDDPARHVFLKGNHEEMMLNFIKAPSEHGRRWLRYGGLQTAASFGIGGLNQTSDEPSLRRARDALVSALGDDLLAWLHALPTRFTSGNVAVVHAGADPALPIADQAEDTLIWGHSEFSHRTRNDNTWVVHGHTVKSDVAPEFGRIGVDTGAFATGRLSAALIGPDRFEPVSVTYRDCESVSS